MRGSDRSMRYITSLLLEGHIFSVSLLAWQHHGGDLLGVENTRKISYFLDFNKTYSFSSCVIFKTNIFYGIYCVTILGIYYFTTCLNY